MTGAKRYQAAPELIGPEHLSEQLRYVVWDWKTRQPVGQIMTRDAARRMARRMNRLDRKMSGPASTCECPCSSCSGCLQ